MIEKKATFGFKDVDIPEKLSLVTGVFNSVAQKYDIMNDLMSFGIHRMWKDALVNMIRPMPHDTLVDVAGGTGDIAFRFLQKGGGSVTICDLTEAMVCVGRDRALNRGLTRGLDWIVGDAQSLPVRDACFNIYTIAFGLRNVGDIDAALKEAYRVLKPKGRFLCLEFCPRQANAWLESLYRWYAFTILPKMGKIVVGDEESYVYLVESIRRFPEQRVLAEKMEAVGFKDVSYSNLTGSVVAIHTGCRA